MNQISPDIKKKLFEFKNMLEKTKPTIESRWERAILLDKSLLHNLYINVNFDFFGDYDIGFNILAMTIEENSAFSPTEKKKIKNMIDENGIEWSTEFINSLFTVMKGKIKCQSFFIEQEYLEIKKAIYKKHHPLTQLI